MTTTPIIGIRDQGVLGLIQSLLQQGTSVKIQVSGRSMLPFLEGGETVELSPIIGSKLRRGDLLLHTSTQNNPLIHRLVRRRFINKVLHLQTKGDGCACLDPFVPASQVLARVRSVTVSDGKTGKKGTTNLDTTSMRLKGYLIARRGLSWYYLRRIKVVTKSLILSKERGRNKIRIC